MRAFLAFLNKAVMACAFASLPFFSVFRAGASALGGRSFSAYMRLAEPAL